MPNTNASDTLFGWDFQINAAIVLMLEDIADVSKVRVEGKTEDIELTMVSGGHIYSQAKSVVRSTDYKNVRSKLSDALGTLNEASKQADCLKLVYVTNSNNPLKDPKAMSIFYGPARRTYNSLPNSSKKVIDNIIATKSYTNLDKSKLSIYVLPFETDDLQERYKVIIEKVKDFITSVKPALSGIAQSVLDIWQKQLFENATFHNTELVITKEDLMWPLIVIMADNDRNNNPFMYELDDCEYAEVAERYKTFIDCRCQKFKFTTQVISDFQSYESDKKGNERVIEFITEHWKDYLDEFSSDAMEEMIQSLVKVTLFRVIQQRWLISDVKKKVNLL